MDAGKAGTARGACKKPELGGGAGEAAASSKKAVRSGTPEECISRLLWGFNLHTFCAVSM